MASGKGRKISGIYVPISLDTSAVERDLSSLTADFARAGDSIQKSFNGSLNSHGLVKGFIDISRAVGQLRDSAKALEHVKPMGDFSQTLRTLSPELTKLAQTMGLTEQAQRELLERMATNQAVNQQVNALRSLERALGLSRHEVVQLAESYGLLVSQAARTRYLGQQSSDIQRLTDEYHKLARAAGQVATQRGLEQFLRTNRIREAVAAFKQLNPGLDLTRKYYQQIAQAANAATSEVAAYIRTQEKGSKGRGWMGIFSPTNISAGVQSAMGALGVVGGMYGVVELGKASVEAALKMDNLKTAFESIFNSSAKAENELNFVRQTADKLGLSFVDAAESAKMLFASAQGTVLEKDAQKIFKTFSEAGAALKLSGDKMQSVFLAISQMMAKGKVSAEELRSQLAEHFPGAVTLFAKAIGVSTQQLDKMLQDGAVGLDHLAKFVDAVAEKYSAAGAAASTSLQAELNRVSNAWFDLKRAFVDSDALADSVRSLGSALQFVANHADGISTITINFVKFVAISAGIYGAIRAITALGAAVKGAGGVMAASTNAITGLIGILTRFPSVASVAAGVLGLVGTAVLNMSTEMDAGERAVKKLSLGFDEQAAAAERAGKSIEEMNERQRQVELKSLSNEVNKAAQTLRAFFNVPAQMELPAGVVDEEMEKTLEALSFTAKSGVQHMFDDLRVVMTGEELSKTVEAANVVTEKLGQEFQRGLADGLNADGLSKIWEKAETELKALQNTMADQGATDAAMTAFDKLRHNVEKAAEDVIKAKQKFEEANTTIGKTSDVAAKAQTAFEALSKLTQNSDEAKTKKLNEQFDSMSRLLIDVDRGASQAEAEMTSLGDSVDHNSEQWLTLQGRVDQLTNILPLVASEAIRNGKDFDTMANSLWNAGVQAGYTYDELMRLYSALQASFNVEIGKVIEKDLEALDLKTAQVGAKVADITAFNTLSKVMGETAKRTEVFTAVQTRNAAQIQAALKNTGVSVEQIEKVLQKSSLYGAKSEASRGGGRRRSGAAAKAREATQELSAMAKECQELEKKIGVLQAKIDDDPSAKYWAEVGGELTKINNLIEKQNAGTEEERKKLIALKDEYEKLATDRARQMEEEERRAKALQYLQSGQGWGNLPDVNHSISADANKKALEAAYAEQTDMYLDMLNSKIIGEEEFEARLDELRLERAVKEAEADSSMLASFTAALQEQGQQLIDWREQIADTLVDGILSASDALADFTVKGMKNAEDLQQAFTDLVNNMIQDLARLFMRMMIMSAMNSLFDAFFGGFSSAGNPGAPNGTNISSNPNFVGPVKPFAKGAVFAGGGDISAFSGKVVKGPTIFSGQPLRAYAKGGNLMGEKGPEAIMPLRRGPGGRLGVDASAISPTVELNQPVNITVYNSADARVSAQQSRNANGSLDIQIMVEKMVGEAMTRTGSAPFNALRGVWRGQPELAKRG